jgi:hypothetical protein
MGFFNGIMFYTQSLKGSNDDIQKQYYCALELCPSSRISECTKDHNASETGSILKVKRWEISILFGPLKRANLNHGPM